MLCAGATARSSSRSCGGTGQPWHSMLTWLSHGRMHTPVSWLASLPQASADHDISIPCTMHITIAVEAAAPSHQGVCHVSDAGLLLSDVIMYHHPGHLTQPAHNGTVIPVRMETYPKQSMLNAVFFATSLLVLSSLEAGQSCLQD